MPAALRSYLQVNLHLKALATLVFWVLGPLLVRFPPSTRSGWLPWAPNSARRFDQFGVHEQSLHYCRLSTYIVLGWFSVRTLSLAYSTVATSWDAVDPPSHSHLNARRRSPKIRLTLLPCATNHLFSSSTISRAQEILAGFVPGEPARFLSRTFGLHCRVLSSLDCCSRFSDLLHTWPRTADALLFQKVGKTASAADLLPALYLFGSLLPWECSTQM